MFKTLFFIALITLAAAKSHRQDPDLGTDPCIKDGCSAEMKACMASQGCFETMEKCHDDTNQGAPTAAEGACLQKDDEAWAFAQCIVNHCGPEPSHKQSKLMKKLAKRYAH